MWSANVCHSGVIFMAVFLERKVSTVSIAIKRQKRIGDFTVAYVATNTQFAQKGSLERAR